MFRKLDSVSVFRRYLLGLRTRDSSLHWAQLSRYHLNTATESSLRNLGFK
jgi:hypothetical protein